MNKNNIFFIGLISLQLYSSSAGSLYKQGIQCLEQHDKKQAIAYLNKAHTMDPNYDEITIQLASVHFFSREYQQAISYFEHYLTRNPHDQDMLYYLGCAHNRLGNFSNANEYFERSYSMCQDEIARVELLKNYIRDQQWHNAERFLEPTLWWYSSNLYGKRILLDMAKDGNGIGDIIFFLRYAKYLKQAGAHVIGVVPKMLHPLCSCCPYLDAIVENKNETIFDQSYSICIASLIMHLKHKAHIPCTDTPYLEVPHERSEAWHKTLHSNKKLKIGLYWEASKSTARFLGRSIGNPRTIPFDHLSQLQSLPGVTWYCLHKNVPDWPSKFPIKSLGPSFDMDGAFMDSMAIIKELDLVISIDGPIAHLAGALGVPVWVLLPVESDYRWFSNRSDTPWYSSMRLFAQPTYGDWKHVIQQIKKELQTILLMEL